MFGYVLINKEELKFKEYDVYKSYYCGLCQTLNNRSGRFAQLTLNYDMTFLQLLLTGQCMLIFPFPFGTLTFCLHVGHLYIR